MSSHSLLALATQKDFTSLSARGWQQAGMMATLVGHEAFSSSGNLKNICQDTATDLAPDSMITPEIHDLIANWTSDFSHQQEASANHAGGTVDSLENGEPMRCHRGVLAPPKRFYRTFWRSLVRKAIRHEYE